MTDAYWYKVHNHPELYRYYPDGMNHLTFPSYYAIRVEQIDEGEYFVSYFRHPTDNAAAGHSTFKGRNLDEVLAVALVEWRFSYKDSAA